MDRQQNNDQEQKSSLWIGCLYFAVVVVLLFFFFLIQCYALYVYGQKAWLLLSFQLNAKPFIDFNIY